MTPGDWVQETRVAGERELLEAEDAAPKQVAGQCGFADVDTLRRAFVRRVGVTPAEYRKRYARDD
jgi:transcriptional regulator GlxA family with amidase domain